MLWPDRFTLEIDDTSPSEDEAVAQAALHVHGNSNPSDLLFISNLILILCRWNICKWGGTYMSLLFIACRKFSRMMQSMYLKITVHVTRLCTHRIFQKTIQVGSKVSTTVVMNLEMRRRPVIGLVAFQRRHGVRNRNQQQWSITLHAGRLYLK